MSDTKHKVQMLVFSASWCGPCRMMAPVIDEIKKEFDDKQWENSELEIKKVNIDDSGDIATDYNVRAVPTIVFTVDGVEQKRLVGLQNKILITNALNLVTK